MYLGELVCRRRLLGKVIEFTVIRDGKPVRRRGRVTRVGPMTIWTGVFCYHWTEIDKGRPREVSA